MIPNIFLVSYTLQEKTWTNIWNEYYQYQIQSFTLSERIVKEDMHEAYITVMIQAGGGHGKSSRNETFYIIM